MDKGTLLARAGSTASENGAIRTTPLRGVASSYSLAEWRALGYSSDHEVVGAYLFMPKPSTRLKPASQLRMIKVSAECPYCHERLERLDPRDGAVSGRILRAIVHGDTVDVILGPVPPGVVVARCAGGCRAVFTIPESGKAVGAVDPVDGIDVSGPRAKEG